eukprot:TRINITY_DN6994_c0_g1_i1.p1 TRINITY_DN6994_c0_g1~~TRINITY_DN6994_c0_g1_i1.p1  ORF type:complete len:112 (+),score=4.79 TRINITY_DN6994_c0_g1_i1:40-375(+)
MFVCLSDVIMHTATGQPLLSASDELTNECSRGGLTKSLGAPSVISLTSGAYCIRALIPETNQFHSDGLQTKLVLLSEKYLLDWLLGRYEESGYIRPVNDTISHSVASARVS